MSIVAFAIVALAAASAGVLHVVAYYGRRPVLAGATKALPILILLGWVLASSVVVSPVYRTFVAVGLAFGMGGDLLLLSPTRFRAGLASFFVGHVAYLLAFTVGSPPFGAVWWAAGLIVLVAGELLRRLWPHVRSERVPVAAYVVVIALMAWTAVARALDVATPQPSGLVAALGAVVFMASDTVLAFDRFVLPWRGAHAAIMVTYYAAQILIARSVAG